MANGYTKRAIKRDPTAPPGTATVLFWIDCECGRCVPVAWTASLHRCDCGMTYDARGWIVVRHDDPTDDAETDDGLNHPDHGIATMPGEDRRTVARGDRGEG